MNGLPEQCPACGSACGTGGCKRQVNASAQLPLLDCKCGASAKIWLVNKWAFTGCRCCGIAAAAYKNFKQSQKDWNKIASI